MILDRILANKCSEVAQRRSSLPLEQLRELALTQTRPRDFLGALKRAGRPALIAECKKASPSKGLLRPEYNPAQLARTYAANGAAALSVLTDEKFFQGALRDLTLAREATGLPALRKDFIIDGYQVYEARAAGADAVLLIVAALRLEHLQELQQQINELGMLALVEVHDETELETALKIGPKLIGVNNRNLHDFSVDLQTTARLRKSIPANIALVAESGIRTAADVARVRKMGVDAILVGEALVTAGKVGAKVRELVTR
ncbi:indole-3-glycerol phosphate synthase [Thermoflexales bacterium]|nr:indole-3-glycerol phosphate synthase [Thermoflexales bacterium]